MKKLVFGAVYFSLHIMLAHNVYAEAEPLSVVLTPPKYPVPSTVSAEAQILLGRDIVQASQFDLPQTTEQWRTFIDARNAEASHHVANTLAAFDVEIEKKTIAGVTVREVVPSDSERIVEGVALLNVHGGGYTMMAGDLSVFEAAAAAGTGGFRVYAVDYRMPPEHPFPAAVDDALAVYKALLDRYPANKIGIFGSSAGGGLAAAVTLAAREQGLPLPGAVGLNTPWSDLTKTGDSYFSNDGVDPVLTSYDGSLGARARLYAGKRDLKEPLLSPIYADYSLGFPPTFLLSGTRDLFLSNTVHEHRALRRAGIDAELHVFEAMWHGFGGPEGMEAQRELARFFTERLVGQ